jgi:hypothetical protein
MCPFLHASSTIESRYMNVPTHARSYGRHVANSEGKFVITVQSMGSVGLRMLQA